MGSHHLEDFSIWRVKQSETLAELKENIADVFQSQLDSLFETFDGFVRNRLFQIEEEYRVRITELEDKIDELSEEILTLESFKEKLNKRQSNDFGKFKRKVD